MKDTGSIAEASLKLSGIFEVAQQVADDFVDSVAIWREDEIARISEHEKRTERALAEAEAKATELLRDCTDKCSAMEAAAREKCEKLVADAKAECERMETEHEGTGSEDS